MARRPKFSHQPGRSLAGVRTRLRRLGVVPGPMEGGGGPAGYFTGATGIMIYRGDAWPSEYRGLAFVGDVGSNLVHRKRISPAGVGFTAERIDEASDFDVERHLVPARRICKRSRWHALRHRHVPRNDRASGQLAAANQKTPRSGQRPRAWADLPRRTAGIQAAEAAEAIGGHDRRLVSTLQSQNGWHRDTAARLLYEQQARPRSQTWSSWRPLPNPRWPDCTHTMHSMDWWRWMMRHYCLR